MRFYIMGLFILSNFISPSFAATPLTLDDYLGQVKEQNAGMKGALSSAQGGELRSQEGSLLLSPTVYAGLKLTSDSKLPPSAFIVFDSILINTYSLGISQLTSFGLQAKLHYDLFTQNYTNPKLFFPLPAGTDLNYSFANASPVLELTQNLWSNGFGRGTRANQEQLEAQALASSYASSYQAKASLTEAEVNYWRLAVARQTLLVQKEALDRASKIYDWNTRRAKLHLGDESDVLQAEALVKTRELDVLTAQNEEKSASRAFNSSRNLDSDQVKETLTELNPEALEKIAIPIRSELRDDVRAAQQSARAASAGAQLALERDNPTLDLVATAALNGQQGYTTYTNLSQSIGPSFSLNRPTLTVGLTFSAPLDFGTRNRSRDGWRLEQTAADLNYSRKLFEQDTTWKELNQSFTDAKERLTLSRKIESIQSSKLLNEKERLKHGRTTTYQVLLFEQDFLQAQLGRIRGQVNVLNLIAQMKLFGERL